MEGRQQLKYRTGGERKGGKAPLPRFTFLATPLHEPNNKTEILKNLSNINYWWFH